MDAAPRTESGSEPTARRRRRFRLTAAVALTAVLLTPALAACSSAGLDQSAEPLGDEVAAATPDESSEPELEELEVELDVEEPAFAPAAGGVQATTTGPHAFNDLAADGVTPISYDPCQPIPYVVRPDGAPAEGDQLIDEALAMVVAATGLTFVDEGATDEGPSVDERELYQYDRYGDRVAPVLIVWSNGDEAPELGSDDGGESETLGYAYSDAVYATDDDSDTAPMVYATGEVVLDAPDLQWELDEGEGYEYVRAVIAHELAHLVGLDHVEDAGELMNPMIDGLVQFGPGDLQGLSTLGRGVCYPAA
jgi:hypothetical protein